MIFRILPQTRIDWKDVGIGGIVTAVMFSVGKFLIGIYIGKSLPASSYGAAGTVIVLIAWIYYSALILYFGAEFTRAYTEKYGSRAGVEIPVEAEIAPQVKARAHHA
jgi:membrane protein